MSKTNTLEQLHLQITGELALECRNLMLWTADIRMHSFDDYEQDAIKTTSIGEIQFATGSNEDDDLIDELDSVSGDLHVFAPLLTDAAVADQLSNGFAADSILIIDRTFIKPPFRGHDISAWACAQLIHQTTMGSWNTIVASYPMPTEKRPNITDATGAARLAANAHKFGLQPLTAYPDIVASSTSTTTMTNARHDLSHIADLQFTGTIATNAITDLDNQHAH